MSDIIICTASAEKWIKVASSYARPSDSATLFHYVIIAGSLEAAYSLNWGAQEIWGKGGGETLALLW